jgi:tRNA U34 5-methylaminomethyl-2-thiouridine-forming methyltransferase MnmC
MAAPSARTCSSPATGCPRAGTACERFHIAELGFGTGLNLIETWRQWIAVREPGQQLKFTSFEAYPMAADDMARALERWPELEGLADQFIAKWRQSRTRSGNRARPTDNPES